MFGTLSSWYIFSLSAVFAGFVLFASPGYCSDTLEGVSPSLAPYEIVTDNGVNGLAHAVMKAVAEAAGFHYLPKRISEKSTIGLSSCSKGMMTLAALSREIDPCWKSLGTVFESARIIVGLKKTPLRSLRDVRGKRVAVIDGSQFEARTALSGVVVYRTDNHEDSLRLLVSGKVDYVVGAALAIRWTARQMGAVTKSLGSPLELGRDDVALYVSTAAVSAEDRRRLEEVLNRKRDNGEFLSVIGKYEL